MKKITAFLILVIFSHLIILSRIRFTLWPEMATYPYFQSVGLDFYSHMVNPYFPTSLSILGWVYGLLGYSETIARILTTLYILLLDIVLLLITKKLFKEPKITFFTLLFFVFWQPVLGGNGLWFDLLTVLPLLISFYLLTIYQTGKKTKDLFISSVFLAFAFFLKQSAVWLYIPFLIIVLRQDKNELLKRSIAVFSPLVVILGVFAAYYFLKGTLKEFLYWTLYFPFFQMKDVPGQAQGPISLTQLLAAFLPVSLPLLFTIASSLSEEKNKVLILIWSWTIFSLFFIIPRFGFFHLQPTLPFLSMIFGITALRIVERQKKMLLVISCVIIFLSLGAASNNFQKEKGETRFFERDKYIAAEWINKNTERNEKIYIFNSYEQLYVLAKKVPATSFWSPMFSWNMELPGIQDKIIDGLKKEQPKIIIFTPFTDGPRFTLGSYRPKRLADYIEENYTLSAHIINDIYVLRRNDLL